MKDSVFLDTNILVYAHTDIDVVKQAKAQALIINNYSFISTQVLQELSNTLNRKFKHNWKDIANVLADAVININLFINTYTTILSAIKIAERYNYSFYDSMILAAALESKCTVLYSEDLHDGHVVDGKLTIKNPFK